MSGILGILLSLHNSFTPFTTTYTTSQTITVPAGATSGQMELYGSGAGGGNCIVIAHPGGGGASGGVCQTTQAVTGGLSLVLTIGAPGAAVTNSTASTLVAGTQSLTTMTVQAANHGASGTVSVTGAAGAAAGATGGNVGNLPGHVGGSPAGGTAVSGALGTGTAGGNGANTAGGTGATGGTAKLIIRWS